MLQCSIELWLAMLTHDYQSFEREGDGRLGSDLTTTQPLFQSHFGVFQHACLHSGLSCFRTRVIQGISLACWPCVPLFIQSHQNRSGPPWWKQTSSPPEIQKSTRHRLCFTSSSCDVFPCIHVLLGCLFVREGKLLNQLHISVFSRRLMGKKLPGMVWGIVSVKLVIWRCYGLWNRLVLLGRWWW